LPSGVEGRRWRALLTETQVVLHSHPWNEQRIAQGLGPINSLWFWGAGRLPRSVATPHAQVRSRDALLRALATAAGVQVDGEQSVDALVDLRPLRSLDQLANQAVTPLLLALRRGELKRLVLDFEDGVQFSFQRSQRWQFWKKPRQLHG
ncbi:MAG: phosphoglycerate mutase, partial [Stenotrophomonas sp.]|nr:phosphoglycerate mutase [Stenotrophomonas sp.]